MIKKFLKKHLNEKTKKQLQKIKRLAIKPSTDKLEREAFSLYKQKKWKKTISIYSQILKKHPEKLKSESYARLAIAQRFVKKYDASESTIKKGLKLYPDSIGLLIEYAALKNSKGNWQKAVQLWEKAKQKSNHFTNLNYNRYTKAYLMTKESILLSNPLSLADELNTLCKDAKFEISLVKNIASRAIEVYHKNNDAQLGIRLLQNNQGLFKTNTVLYQALATILLESGALNEALNNFELLVYNLKINFASNENSKEAICYKMVHQEENLPSLFYSAMKLYPLDQKIYIRYIYASFLNNFRLSHFSKALREINLLLATNQSDFWYMSRDQLLLYRNECIRRNEITSINSNSSNLLILANRSDGLGERINAMLNAVVLSKTFGYHFGYTWKSETFASHLQQSAEKNQNLVGHAIVEEKDFFSKDFITNYSLNSTDSIPLHTINSKNLTYADIYKTEREKGFHAWIAPRLELKEHFSDELLINNIFTYREAFSFLKFSDEISYSIALAKKVMKDETYIALHLRSGDVFYGEYRKFVHYTYKGIVLPLAKAMIEQHIQKGMKVVVFGQDLPVLQYLKDTYNITLVEDFQEYSTFDTTQKAMFEIILMSEAESIIAGSSGFAKLASWIGNKDVKSPLTYYNAQDQTDIIKNDLQAYGSEYPKLQTSFAYWYAYYYGRKQKSIDEIEFLLTQASQYDPDNELYPLVLAANLYNNKLFIKAEKILEDLFIPNKNFVNTVLLAKTMGKYNLLEFIPYFRDASQKEFLFASIVMYYFSSNIAKKRSMLDIIKKHEKHEYAKTFLEHNG